MAAPTAAELTALAEELREGLAKLAQTMTTVDRHIDAKGKAIGEAFGLTYAKAAKEQVAEVEKAAATEIQRRDDVIEELRKRLADVRLCKVWHDDLGRGFVFVDELAHAVDPDTYPAPAPVRLDKES